MDGEGYKNKESISNPIIKAYNSARNKQASKLLCHAPFSSLRFSQSGNVLACCFNRGWVLGKYPEQSLDDIWFGEPLKELRKNIQHNDLSSGCGECARRLEKRLFNLSGALQYDYLSRYDQRTYPAMLDFEISNICNLECIMCLGENSSAIRSNREKLPPFGQHYDQRFVNQLGNFIPHLKEARFSGGEPFLVPLYYDIWERIITVNPGADISVLTNATILNEKIMNLLALGNFRISVSIDSLEKETYSKIRVNADFDTVKENLEYFYEYSLRKNSVFSLNVCPMPHNYKEIPAIVKYCNEKNIQLILHTVVFPPSESLWALDSGKLKDVFEYLAKSKIETKGKVGKNNLLTYEQFVLQVSSWKENAGKREALKMELAGKDEKDLYELLGQNLLHVSGEPILVLVEMLMKTGLAGKERKNTLINMLSFPPDLILSEFLHSGPDKLLIRLKMFNY